MPEIALTGFSNKQKVSGVVQYFQPWLSYLAFDMPILTNPFLRAIDRLHVGANNLVKDRFPLFSLYFFIKPREWVFWKTQPVHRLIKGEDFSKSKHPSIIFFTVHKSASMFSAKVIHAIASASGLPHIDVEGYHATKGPKANELTFEPDFLNKVFHPRGYFYGPLRLFRNVKNIESYKVILLLRDPRDILTSHYFSVRHSHLLVSRKYIRRRKIALTKTIDEHAIDHIPRFYSAYKDYVEQLVGKPFVHFIRYEDWVMDFKTEVDKLTDFCELKISPQQKEQLYALGNFDVKSEDVNQHKRRVTPGDFREKLKPETIARLNDAFGDILKKLNYPLA